MFWKLTVFAIVLLGVVSVAKSRRPLDRAIKRAKIQKFQKQAKLNGVKSFLKRFCEDQKYEDSTVCQKFFECKCGGDDNEGLFQCFARECNENAVDSFFCDWIKCKTDLESNEADDECTLGHCETYKESLDVGEKAICTKIKFWKAMKECRPKGKGRKNARNDCINQICADGSYKEECDGKLFWKNMSKCYKNFRGPQNITQREECQKQLCDSNDSNEKSCKQIAFWKNVRECRCNERDENLECRKRNTAEEVKDCLSNLCEDEGCENPYCKYFNKQNKNTNKNCIDRCA